jgi:hypothetical protein
MTRRSGNPEMVDRVAEAMYEAFMAATKNAFPPDHKRDSFWQTEAHVRAYYRRAARAGIECMREPTVLMLLAGDRFVTKDDPELGNAWRAMIDNALTADWEHSQYNRCVAGNGRGE